MAAAEQQADRSRRRRNIAGVVFGALMVLGLGLGRVGGSLPIGQGGSGPDCDDPVAWERADAVTGQEAAVAGPVAAVRTEPEVGGAPTFVNLGNGYPDRPRFDVVVYEEVRESMEHDPEESLDGAVVCVVGEVRDREGVPQTVLDSALHLVVED